MASYAILLARIIGDRSKATMLHLLISTGRRKSIAKDHRTGIWGLGIGMELGHLIDLVMHLGVLSAACISHSLLHDFGVFCSIDLSLWVHQSTPLAQNCWSHLPSCVRTHNR